MRSKVSVEELALNGLLAAMQPVTWTGPARGDLIARTFLTRGRKQGRDSNETFRLGRSLFHQR